MSLLSGKTTFTLAEVAELLSCHRETLRRAIRDGELQAAKLGREFRVSKRDLEAFWSARGGGELFERPEPQSGIPVKNPLPEPPGQKKEGEQDGFRQLSLLEPPQKS